MSDYISLEDLKAMSDDQLYDIWCEGRFPFERSPCGKCVTEHATLARYGEFSCKDHQAFNDAAELIISVSPVRSIHHLRQNLDGVYSLRIFFKDLYASNPPEIMQPVASVEVAEVRA